MEEAPRSERTLLDWSVAARPMSGQSVSGDLHLVKWFDHCVLVAVIDGIGHGDEAAAAARAAADILENYPGETTISLFKRCHEALVKTRGVVLTVAILDTVESTITWLGVGNVDGRLVPADGRARHPRGRVL